LSYPAKDSCCENSIETCRNTRNVVDRGDGLSLSKSIKGATKLIEVISKNQRTISHNEPKLSSGLWKIKQLNKVYDKEKTNLLLRHRESGRRNALSSMPSNLMASSISPLSKQSKKHSTALD
jgi:hypothetical protein